MNIKQEELLVESHQQWLDHPVTRLLISNLHKHKVKFIDSGIMDVNKTELDDKFFRIAFSNIKTVDAILKMITTTDVFKSYL